MQKAIRVNENQLLYLANKARIENSISGYLNKKSGESAKWQLRWFSLYQNLLFYYENDSTTRPSGIAFLEGCYCERILTPNSVKGEKQLYSFAINFTKEGQRQYDLAAESEVECNAWIDAIKMASFSRVIEQKEQLEQKHLHLLQILDSERKARWQYVQQTEELTEEVKKLKTELREFKTGKKDPNHVKAATSTEEESDEIKKIKKVQSFFRGWLCRRRWKQIVEEYIRSPHAEMMRKRNSIVFGMVEGEEEYVKQLSTLVSCFLRPMKMAASSKKPPITHEDVNSIFLNSETVLFLHQIFMKGLCARMENWPTLVLGDLFDMLLPMLGIYQEYVRNHHYSLQVLAEYKQKLEFSTLLKRYEEKPPCEGRSLETFLTYPMHQIPRYIVTLHDLLAHTPHDHVERKSLEYAKGKLEELSRVMHDEVSETENIRKNLAIERMIIEGCDILLDVNQTFVRQGCLLQVMTEKVKPNRGRLGSFSSSFKESKKETVRQVFLFTNHLLITSRASNGRLHLAKNYGKIPLIDCTLVEDSNSDIFFFDDEASSMESLNNLPGSNTLSTPNESYSDKKLSIDYKGLDFKIIVDSKSGPPMTITLVASSLQDKAAWCSDISQCIENLHYSDLLNSSMSDTSSVTMPQSVRYIHSTQIWSDPKLFRDDIDIKFSRTLNSCKVPQIRHASVDKLLERLTDLRFLSIDFVNTFLLTYRVFTNGDAVLEALKKVYKNPECGGIEGSGMAPASLQAQRRHIKIREADSWSMDSDVFQPNPADTPPVSTSSRNSTPDAKQFIRPQPEKPRRISTGSMKIEVTGAEEKTASSNEQKFYLFKFFSNFLEEKEDSSTDSEKGSTPTSTEVTGLLFPPKRKLAPIASCETLSDFPGALSPVSPTSMTRLRLGHFPGESSSDSYTLQVPTDPNLSQSSDTLTGGLDNVSSWSHSTNSGTLTPGSNGDSLSDSPTKLGYSAFTPIPQRTPNRISFRPEEKEKEKEKETGEKIEQQRSPSASPKMGRKPSPVRSSSPLSIPLATIAAVLRRPTSPLNVPQASPKLRRSSSPVTGASPQATSPVASPKLKRASSPIIYSFSSPSIISPQKPKAKLGSVDSTQSDSGVCLTSPRHSLVTMEGSPPSAKAGAVITSSRPSKRRSSSSAATTAFAAATAGVANTNSENQNHHPKGINRYHSAVWANGIPGMSPAHPTRRMNRYHSFTGAGDLKPYNVNKKRESVISTAATMRVLNVLRHWVSKHSQDFETDPKLKAEVKDLLEEMVCNTNLLPAEHKAAASILRTMAKEESANTYRVDLVAVLSPPLKPSKDTFDTLSALDIAEQLTYLDHHIFMAIRSEELLCQAWMKPDKAEKAPHVLMVSKRFNEVSRLVVSEIVRRPNFQERIACIEKWAAIADICRCLHNYNGVLQICAAFVNSSVYRLKKTWDKLSKQTKQMIEKLQQLVSSDGRFKNMRDALHRCDPPCIPYLGMYLTDLSFIEEGTPNVTEEGLVNFSKMRMVAHVIREIQVFQQTSYKIDLQTKVTAYLLDPTRLLDEEETYKASLEIEPRTSRLSINAAEGK
ncbi:ras-specific guanine nucleotide-releasing factor 1 [Lingula anatina]|uniref:Ras-specific guanine nucleotide-releasing factor 1 n=1 Tax=Lingula anatina TaxID=7574 RepID=A0A1S3IZJ0_LINAN|nr:ras-specific guanine nucleotide-releasing factor 1 [Lingula anatina]|eukprot:XP_013403416.1 ras-specific guanine nucleotide-releasing factor 1 [Lingula anatina]